MTATLPLVQASDSGVTPYRFASSTRAPAPSNRSTAPIASLPHGPVKGSRAVGFRLADVGALLDQNADASGIRCLGGF